MSPPPFSVQRQVIASAHLKLGYYLVPWDSEIFGRPVAQIDSLELTGDDAAATRTLADYDAWRCGAQVALEVAKLDALQLREISLLESQGFRWMEMQYRMRWDTPAGHTAQEDEELCIAPLRPADRAAIDLLAASAFETSRYALDPFIGPELAGRRYRAWLANSLAGGNQQLLVAHDRSGALVGFFLVERRGSHVYWHLTAIDPSQQGRGYGLRLWRHMMSFHQTQGVTRIETSVSAHNLRVLGLYGRIGFRFHQAQVSLHRGGLR